MSKEEEQPGKVQLKAILKGNAAQAIRPAVMSGFRVADFQINPTATKDTPEELMKNELVTLNSHIASLKGEIENMKKKMELDSETAYHKGLAEGKTLGTENGEKKAIEKWNADLKALQGNVAKEFENLEKQQNENFKKINAKTTELALAIAKRIFCEEATNNPNIIVRVMKEAFAFLGQEDKLKVRINPMDIPTAEGMESFWKPVMSSLKSIELTEDNTIKRGGCLLESANGSSIDMRLETIFEHIEESVKKIYSSQKMPIPGE
jgi:flagellar assembly protein FliH